MATPREIYEKLLGINSPMGLGDLADLLRKFVDNAVENGNVNEQHAEEFARELCELLSTGDEFDGEDEAGSAPDGSDVGLQEDEEIDEDVQESTGLAPGESFESIPDER